MRKTMYYAVMNNVDKITKPVLDSFDQLPPDPYLKGDFTFRYRAYGEALVKGDLVHWTEPSDFFQSETINDYAGGLARKFAPLGPEVREFTERFVAEPQLRSMIDAEEFEIGVHQMRVVADGTHTGYPAPEGFHHDGFDYVTVSAIAAHNVNGGVSMLADATDESIIVFDRVMNPGETLVLDDKAMKHYVSPFTPKIPGEARRDVIVVTIKIHA
ncbi:2OG-Fe dioxygenase family protein [Nocardia sp. CDC159]|uniref:2OG-Fe dioxygenase family protein n=1 Tax=Nocardia pulmonis TaxID=2951408 RepID=A0A9X2E541_9NOCA|nr:MULTISPECIES: 2OG-Fe dioxygenase family protein [Nocardia]MCM6774317.1 2OG-Fe dioxygenase family protein [Nocardia pulmonis]MCM6787617.1 2OG-Fe dioxygenase family protein [Nocardia sp. CDC159]